MHIQHDDAPSQTTDGELQYGDHHQMDSWFSVLYFGLKKCIFHSKQTYILFRPQPTDNDISGFNVELTVVVVEVVLPLLVGTEVPLEINEVEGLFAADAWRGTTGAGTRGSNPVLW